MPREGGEADWNARESIDWALLQRDVELLRQGRSVDVPVYDMRTSKRAGARTLEATGTKVVFVEGIFSFLLSSAPPVTRVLLECPRVILFWRRIRRDSSELRRSFVPAAASILRQVVSHRPSPPSP